MRCYGSQRLSINYPKYFRHRCVVSFISIEYNHEIVFNSPFILPCQSNYRQSSTLQFTFPFFQTVKHLEQTASAQTHYGHRESGGINAAFAVCFRNPDGGRCWGGIRAQTIHKWMRDRISGPDNPVTDKFNGNFQRFLVVSLQNNVLLPGQKLREQDRRIDKFSKNCYFASHFKTNSCLSPTRIFIYHGSVHKNRH